MHPLMQVIWWNIWKHTVEKSQRNATNVTLHHLMHIIWGDVWKCTVEKVLKKCTDVTMPLLRQALWGHIWKYTVEKSQTNAKTGYLRRVFLTIWKCLLDIWNKIILDECSTVDEIDHVRGRKTFNWKNGWHLDRFIRLWWYWLLPATGYNRARPLAAAPARRGPLLGVTANKFNDIWHLMTFHTKN